MTSESMTPEISRIASSEIKSNRTVAGLIQVSRQTSGGFNYELSMDTYNSLLKGALFAGEWADAGGGIYNLVSGTTMTSFTIEKSFLDIDQFMLFTGNVVNTFSITLATDAIITGSFGFLGCDSSLNQVATLPAVASPSLNGILNCGTNVSAVLEGTYGGSMNSRIDFFLQEITLNLNNNLRLVNGVGYNTPQAIRAGKQDITGTFSAYFMDETFADKYFLDQEFALSFTVEDSILGGSYSFHIERAKFQTLNAAAQGQDQELVQTYSFQALNDPANSRHFYISRFGTGFTQ